MGIYLIFLITALQKKKGNARASSSFRLSETVVPMVITRQVLYLSPWFHYWHRVQGILMQALSLSWASFISTTYSGYPLSKNAHSYTLVVAANSSVWPSCWLYKTSWALNNHPFMFIHGMEQDMTTFLRDPPLSISSNSKFPGITHWSLTCFLEGRPVF